MGATFAKVRAAIVAGRPARVVVIELAASFAGTIALAATASAFAALEAPVNAAGAALQRVEQGKGLEGAQCPSTACYSPLLATFDPSGSPERRFGIVAGVSRRADGVGAPAPLQTPLLATSGADRG